MKGGRVNIIGIFTDDIIVFFNCREYLEFCQKDVFPTFPMKDLGEVKKFLRVRVTRNFEKGEIILKQTEYIDAILSRFRMMDSKFHSAPLEQGRILEK